MRGSALRKGTEEERSSWSNPRLRFHPPSIELNSAAGTDTRDQTGPVDASRGVKRAQRALGAPRGRWTECGRSRRRSNAHRQKVGARLVHSTHVRMRATQRPWKPKILTELPKEEHTAASTGENGRLRRDPRAGGSGFCQVERRRSQWGDDGKGKHVAEELLLLLLLPLLLNSGRGRGVLAGRGRRAGRRSRGDDERGPPARGDGDSTAASELHSPLEEHAGASRRRGRCPPLLLLMRARCRRHHRHAEHQRRGRHREERERAKRKRGRRGGCLFFPSSLLLPTLVGVSLSLLLLFTKNDAQRCFFFLYFAPLSLSPLSLSISLCPN